MRFIKSQDVDPPVPAEVWMTAFQPPEKVSGTVCNNECCKEVDDGNRDFSRLPQDNQR